MECPSCNADNADGVVFCVVCGAELPKSNPNHALSKGKMAVFHVEEALLSNSAGERIARRKGLSGKRFEREVANNLEKAVSRTGVKDFVNKLGRKNHVIAFISSLEDSYQFRLQDRLRQLGYPVTADSSGPLVLMGDAAKNIRSLGNRYDIVFSFGSSFAAAAKEMDVPGVYATVNDYIGNSKNPYLAPEPTPGSYTLSGLHPAPTPGPYTLTNPNCGCGKNPCVTYGPMANPTSGFTERMYFGDSGDEAADAAYAYSKAKNVILWFQATGAPGDKTHYYGYTSVDDAKNERSALWKEPALVAPKFELGLKREEALKKAEEIATTTGKPLYVAQEYAEKDPYVGFHYPQAFELLYPVDAPIRVDPKVKGGFMGSTVANPLPKPLPQHYNTPLVTYFCGNCGYEVSESDWNVLASEAGGTLAPPCPNCGEKDLNPKRKIIDFSEVSSNPPPKPRRQTSKKTGKKRRESAKKYFDRLMGNKMMNEEFPDNSQRSAVALRYVKEEYGQRGVNSVTKTWGAMTNPTTEGLPIYSGQPTGAKNLGMVSAVVQVGRGFMKDIGEGLQDFYRALVGGRQSMTEKRMMIAVAEMHRDLTNAVKQKGGNAIGNVRLDYEYPAGGGRSLDLTLIATADAFKTRGAVKKNPAKPAKVKKAKDAYKKFHGGKTPDEITTEKIDVGDVWYSLGECWTIGYKSPKENGDEDQKFIHEMNEESKDGNFPTLYATMPESGEPMLIIKGGSMKIGMRDGKAWLID